MLINLKVNHYAKGWWLYVTLFSPCKLFLLSPIMNRVLQIWQRDIHFFEWFIMKAALMISFCSLISPSLNFFVLNGIVRHKLYFSSSISLFVLLLSTIILDCYIFWIWDTDSMFRMHASLYMLLVNDLVILKFDLFAKKHLFWTLLHNWLYLVDIV